MPNRPILTLICTTIIAVRTVATIAFTAVTSFEVILLGKHPKTFFRKVVVSFLQGDVLFHRVQRYDFNE